MRIGVIGLGRLGSALVRGLDRAGGYEIHGYNRSPGKSRFLAAQAPSLTVRDPVNMPAGLGITLVYYAPGLNMRASCSAKRCSCFGKLSARKPPSLSRGTRNHSRYRVQDD